MPILFIFNLYVLMIANCFSLLLQALRYFPISPDGTDASLIATLYVNRASTMHVSLSFTCLHSGHIDVMF